MIAGLEDITSGELTIGGRYMNDVPPVERNVGMVFQSYALYPQNYLWGDFAAAAVLSGFPITVVFLRAQRWLVGGRTAGGVKG